MRTSLENGQDLTIELPHGYRLVVGVSQVGRVAVASFERDGKTIELSLIDILPRAQGA